ncbi:MAG TPA: hypothetical protein VG410_07225 [Solirubrobacteraceae bacterium]|jgi:hypothetical protein|nr:hypothetical protein [Solirubrobacteraceae bacterium]
MTTVQSTEWGPLSEPIHNDIPDGGRPWRDNAFVAFWDADRDIVGTLHTSTSPNAEGRRARFSVQTAGRTIELIEDLEPGSFSSDSISFSAGAEFSIASDRVAGTVTTTPLFALADYTGDRSPEAFSLDKELPLMHYQRAATATGELVIDGHPVAIDGHAFRDRTWGFRDESASVSEYFGCWFILPSLAVSSMKLRGASSAEMVLGSVLEGDATFISSASLTRDASGLFAASAIETVDGRTLEFRIVDRRAGFWCPMGIERTGPTLGAFDEFFTVRTPDGEEGFGMCEQGILKTVF